MEKKKRSPFFGLLGLIPGVFAALSLLALINNNLIYSYLGSAANAVVLIFPVLCAITAVVYFVLSYKKRDMVFLIFAFVSVVVLVAAFMLSNGTSNAKIQGDFLKHETAFNHSAQAISELRKAGISKTVMLTGDADRVALKVAEELSVDEMYSELLPADKVAKVEELLSRCRGREKLAFVGDGINDAPVLSRADIGIAMGALGSDAAIEAADVVLMDDDPQKIVKAIRIARKCLRIVYENIYFAIGVKILCLLLGALGIANMWLAIFADVGVMVIAVLNAIRALFVKNL